MRQGPFHTLAEAHHQAPKRTARFVGRERELVEASAAISDAFTGRGRLLLFTGEPGIGKTSLAEEAALLATTRGMRVRWGRCWEGGGAPAYWPWILVVRQIRSDAQIDELPAEIMRILPECSAVASAPEARLDAEEARFRLFDALAVFLQETARENPTVIVLDDLHEADVASLQLLQFVSRSLHDARLLIIGTYRDAEMRCSAERSTVMNAIGREALVLPIAGLTESEIAELIAGYADGPSPSRSAAELHRATAGNPLFVDGILRALVAEGRLASRVPLDLAGFKLPDDVWGAISRRLDRLSPEARDVLTTASVLGVEFEPELVSCVHGYTADASSDLVGEALEMGIVCIAGASSYRFSHPLLRESLFGALRPEERARRHREVAGALERWHGANSASHVADLAHHWRAAARSAEEVDKAIQYSIRAADAAKTVFAYEDEAAQLRAALQLEARASTPMRRATLLDRLGVATALMDRDESIHHTEEALALYEQLGQEERAAACHTRLADALSPIGQPRGAGKARWNSDVLRARQHLGRAESLLTPYGATPALARLYCGIALNATMGLRMTEGLHATSRATEIADLLARCDLRAAAAGLRAKLLAWRGELAASWAIVEEAWETADREDAAGAAFAATWMASTMAFGLRDTREGVRWCRRELGRPRTARSPLRRQIMLHLLAGDSAALGELTEARTLSPETGWGMLEGRRLFLEGRWEDAKQLLELEIAESRLVGDLMTLSLCARQLASVLRVRGETRPAASLLAETAKEAISDVREPNLMTELQLRSELSRINAQLGHADEAQRDLDRCRTILAMGENWRGLSGDVARAAAVLAATRGNHRDAESEFESALSIFARYTAPWEEADTLECWGAAYLGMEDEERGLAKFDAAIDVYQRIGANRRWVERVTARKGGRLVGNLPASASVSPRTRRSVQAVLRQNGDHWVVSDGETTVTLKDMKGLHYIRELLRHAGEELYVLDLIGRCAERGEGQPDASPLVNVGLPVLDAEARRAYRDRLHELDEELAQAEAFNDGGRADRIRVQIEALKAHLSEVIGIRGKERLTGGSAERARSAVTHGIKAAVGRLRQRLPALGEELALRIKTGTFCTYMPDGVRPVVWKL